MHPILRPLSELADLPLVPSLLATVHEKGQADLMEYKLNFRCASLCFPLERLSLRRTRRADEDERAKRADQDKLLPYLQELTKSQLNRGLITCVAPLSVSQLSLHEEKRKLTSSSDEQR